MRVALSSLAPFPQPMLSRQEQNITTACLPYITCTYNSLSSTQICVLASGCSAGYKLGPFQRPLPPNLHCLVHVAEVGMAAKACNVANGPWLKVESLEHLFLESIHQKECCN